MLPTCSTRRPTVVRFWRGNIREQQQQLTRPYRNSNWSCPDQANTSEQLKAGGNPQGRRGGRSKPRSHGAMKPWSHGLTHPLTHQTTEHSRNPQEIPPRIGGECHFPCASRREATSVGSLGFALQNWAIESHAPKHPTSLQREITTRIPAMTSNQQPATSNQQSATSNQPHSVHSDWRRRVE